MSERSTFWLSHLSAIEAEGITTKAYAEREGLSPQALYQWRKRLVAGGRRSRAKLGGFVPIQIEPSMPARTGCTVMIGAPGFDSDLQISPLFGGPLQRRRGVEGGDRKSAVVARL